MIRSWKTRRRIIEQTASIFNKKGYAGTSISDLTKATGLTKGSIYGNFKDKNEVAIEAFRYNFKTQAKWFLERINRADTFYDKLMVYVTLYREEYQTIDSHGGCPILNTATDADDGNELLKKEVQDALNGWIDHVEYLVQMGISTHEFKTIDTRQFAARMISMIEGGVMMSKTLNDWNVLMHNLDQLEQEINSLRLN